MFLSEGSLKTIVFLLWYDRNEEPITHEKNKRYIGIDLHSDNFYAHYLSSQEAMGELYPLNDDSILDFLSTLKRSDEVAIESSTNTKHFIQQIERHVKKNYGCRP